MSRRSREGVGKHFRLVERSFQDPEYDDANPATHWMYVPVNAAAMGSVEEVVLKTEKKSADTRAAPVSNDAVDADGFPMDGYDYTQHLAVIGGGTFVSKDGDMFELPKQNAASLADPDTHLLPQTLEAVTLDEKSMDPDVLRAMEENDDGDMDEDFMEQLISAETTAPRDAAFDYEAHIGAMMDGLESDEEDDFEEVDRPKNALDDDFELFLRGAGYEDEEDGEDYGEEDSQDEEDLLRNVVKDHAESERRQKEQSDAVLSAKGAVRDVPLTYTEKGTSLEEIMRDMDVMFPPKQRAQHDAATIVSTYSTTENLPNTLVFGKRSVSRRTEVEKSSPSQSIEVSYSRAIAAAAVRARDETAEEKKLRKQAVREAKKHRRIEKKSRKEVFKGEAKRQARNTQESGLSVWKL